MASVGKGYAMTFDQGSRLNVKLIADPLETKFWAMI